MTNQCNGTLIVLGPKEELQKFKDFAKEEELPISANRFIPYPYIYKNLDEIKKEYKEVTDIKLKSAIEKGMDKDAASLLINPGIFIKSGYDLGGKDWCKENWWSDKGFCEVEIEEKSDISVKYGFYTTWGPITPVIRKMGEMFKILTFDYHYYYFNAFNDSSFQGRFVMEIGINTSDECLDFSPLSISSPYESGLKVWFSEKS